MLNFLSKYVYKKQLWGMSVKDLQVKNKQTVKNWHLK